MASVAITRFFCRAQIPIAPPARPRATSRGFVPWRLSDAGPQPRCSRPRPSSAGIRNPSQTRTCGVCSARSASLSMTGQQRVSPARRSRATLADKVVRNYCAFSNTSVARPILPSKLAWGCHPVEKCKRLPSRLKKRICSVPFHTPFHELSTRTIILSPSVRYKPVYANMVLRRAARSSSFSGAFQFSASATTIKRLPGVKIINPIGFVPNNGRFRLPS